MAKIIKRVGIVFFVLVISFLLVVSCATISDIESWKDNSINNGSTELLEVNAESSQSSLMAKNSDYVLKGDCSQMADIWNAAILDSYNNRRSVKITMESDWVAAKSDNDNVTEFGTGVGFEEGKIRVIAGTNITIDLNGHNIDRNLFDTTGADYGYCMKVEGFLNIMDSTYDSNEVYKLLAENRLTQTNVDNLPFGKIKGGNNSENGYYAAGIRVSDGGVMNFYSGIICNNKAIDAAGLTCMRNGYINFYDGLIFGNISTSHGAGICSGIESTVVVRGGVIANNSSVLGAGIFSYSLSTVDLRNVIITNNSAETLTSSTSTVNAAGAGAYISSGCNIKIGLGTQIYGNLCDNKENNLYLCSTNTLQVATSYISAANLIAKHITNVGISLESPRIFTTDFSVHNSTLSPASFFFSDNESYSVVKNGDEAELVNATSTLKTLTWKYNDKTTTNRVMTVTYTGEPFTISASEGNIFKFSNPAQPSYQVTDAGVYAFVSTRSYKNTAFTFIVLPKQIDLEWETNLVYNGVSQSPVAQIKAGQLIGEDSCNVNVFGSEINVGTGYYAEARSLNNSNYKISPLTKSTTYKITPANITVNASTKNSNSAYNGKEVQLNDWYSLSANLLGQDNGKPLTNVFNIDYSKIVPQFTKDGVTTDSAVNVGEYAISIKPFDISKVFSGNSNYNVTVNYLNGGKLTISEANVIRPAAESKYDYLILEGDKRVSYKDKGLIHGDNDSNVNVVDGKANYYMGNISPNTSVNTFISNLVYDKTQIQLYNNKDTIIYDKGNANVNEELLNNGKELAVGTGWYIEYSKDGVTERITLSVLGDVNGDGRISASDVSYLRQIASDSALYENLSEEKKLASMVINKGNVTSADAEIVRNVVDKLFAMDLFF